ncbi:MAG: Hsp20/alpha crystallin family protein [Acidimicrobiales bacterium]
MTDVEVTAEKDKGRTPVPPSWDPFTELEAWTRSLGRPLLPATRWPSLASTFDGVDFTPLADVEETNAGWTIEVELPGIKKKDIEVEATGRSVVITGERAHKEREGVLRQRRRIDGTFRYEVTLGGDFEPGAITAQLVNGELTVTVPKAEDEKPHKIKVV